MTAVHLVYSADAQKSLKKMDKTTALRIVGKSKENTQLFDPLSRAQALSGGLAGCYRYRVGDYYRVIFEVSSDNQLIIYTIMTVKHRKDVYR